tara:strand:+ start:48 stop:254 length:207 start_codon:yes stop_codon:yes gene_type:complete
MAEKKKKTFKESQPEGALKGSFFDYVPDAQQISNYLKQFIGKEKSKTKKYKNGGVVSSGRGGKFKGHF